MTISPPLNGKALTFQLRLEPVLESEIVQVDDSPDHAQAEGVCPREDRAELGMPTTKDFETWLRWYRGCR